MEDNKDMQNNHIPKVSIGMPVFNGEKFIREAIDSLLAQTFTDFELIISDNASDDATVEICKEYEAKEGRIQYIRQKENIGAIWNFNFVLGKACGEYFMWAAADDMWDSNFIKVCIKNLESHKECGMAFCNIINIDSFGRNIRNYPDFNRFSKKNPFKRVITFLVDPGILGKPNLIYSMYRLHFCKEVWQSFQLNNNWGSDMSFVLCALARSNIIIDGTVLFKKRYSRLTDTISEINRITIRHPYMGIFPIRKGVQFMNDHLKAVKHTRYYWITLSIMLFRLFHSAATSLIHLVVKLSSPRRHRIKGN